MTSVAALAQTPINVEEASVGVFNPESPNAGRVSNQAAALLGEITGLANAKIVAPLDKAAFAGVTAANDELIGVHTAAIAAERANSGASLTR